MNKKLWSILTMKNISENYSFQDIECVSSRYHAFCLFIIISMWYDQEFLSIYILTMDTKFKSYITFLFVSFTNSVLRCRALFADSDPGNIILF